MPVVLAAYDWDTWLDPRPSTDEVLLPLLKPFAPDTMQLWAVSNAVGRVSSQGEELIRPVRPSYSIAPTTDIVVIRDGVLGRMGSLMRWSLILYWAKDTRKVPLLHNIRSEAIRVDPLVGKPFGASVA